MYPLKFRPQYFEKIWGGQKIQKLLNKNVGPIANCGESWEISGVPGKVSEAVNGFLASNGLDELVEIYMGDLVGEKVFDQFGNDFPLLIKFIDAQDDLSVQVHPDDALAQRRYGMNGKTELWFVLQADDGAGLYVGFKKGVTKADYLAAVEAGNVNELLNFYPVQPGDAFYIPAGTVHAIGKGVLLTEIQQSSDCTYRIFDWNRVDAQGNARELHTADAEDAIHFGEEAEYHAYYVPTVNKTISVKESKYFNINLLHFTQPLEKVYAKIDSFVIYICLEGKASFIFEEEEYEISKGEVVLLPAIATDMVLLPYGEAKLLEVYL